MASAVASWRWASVVPSPGPVVSSNSTPAGSSARTRSTTSPETPLALGLTIRIDVIASSGGRCVAAHPVGDDREEPIREGVRVRVGSDPRVRPVRRRQDEQDSGLDVELGPERAALGRLATQVVPALLVPAALGPERGSLGLLEEPPLAGEDRRCVDLRGDDREVD